MNRLSMLTIPVLALLVHASFAQSDAPDAPAAAPRKPATPTFVLPAPSPFGAGVLVRRDLEYGTGSGRALHNAKIADFFEAKLKTRKAKPAKVPAPATGVPATDAASAPTPPVTPVEPGLPGGPAMTDRPAIMEGR